MDVHFEETKLTNVESINVKDRKRDKFFEWVQYAWTSEAIGFYEPWGINL